MSRYQILVIDDEPLVLDFLTRAIIRMGHEATGADTGEKAKDILESESFDLILSDLKLPGISGLDVLEFAQRRHPDTPFIMLTAHGTIENAVQAMQRGAFHYLTKPVDNTLLRLTLERALEKRKLLKENRSLRSIVESEQGIRALIGSSTAMMKLLDTLTRVSMQPVDVLVTGPSGTGKELVARALHWSSPRAKGPFIKMNCAALPESLVESELFGHEKGAFTGAIKTRKGKFEAAHKGTILLDEISEMPLSLQAKLLRVLQEREFERVGSNDTIKVDVRVVATTNKNLQEEVKNGNFREDLFFRLNVVPLHLPPLVERREDIPSLVNHFLDKYGQRYGRQFEGVDKDALTYLKAQPWQGNVRELENRIERAVVLARDLTIQKEDVSFDTAVRNEIPAESYGDLTLAELEKRHILSMLDATDFNRTQAADRLGISIRTLRNKLNEYRAMGLDIPKGN